MATYNKFNNFVQHLGEKKINLATDQLTVALTTAANPPAAANSVLADLTQISYTNLSTRNITTTSYTNSAGTSKLILADLTLTASGGAVATFRYVAIFSDSATNKELIGYYDIGSNVTLADTDQLIIDFDQVNGFLTIV